MIVIKVVVVNAGNVSLPTSFFDSVHCIFALIFRLKNIKSPQILIYI